MRYKIPILFMLLAALGISMLSGCELMPAEEALPTMPTVKEYEPVTYEEVAVQRGDLVSSISVSVQYKALRKEAYKFDASLKGQKIGTCHVTTGQLVKEGDLLLELDNSSIYTKIEEQKKKVNAQKLKLSHVRESNDLELRLQNAKLALCESELAAVRELIQSLAQWETQVSPTQPRPTDSTMEQLVKQEIELLQDVVRQQKTVETTQTNNQKKLDNAQAALDLLQQRLDELNVSIKQRCLYAWFDGMVTFVDNFDSYPTVKDRNVLTVVDTASMMFAAESSYTSYFPTGTKVEIQVDRGQTYSAVSVGNTPGGDPNAKVVYFQTEEALPALKENTNGTIEVILDSRENVLFLEVAAVHSSDSGDYVSVLGADGTRVNKVITTGLRCNGLVEIISGLAEGEKVIVE